MNRSLKSLVAVWSFLLFLPGFGVIVSGCALVVAAILAIEGREALVEGIAFAVFLAVSLGGGWFSLRQTYQSMREKPSRPLRLPPLWALGGGFVLALAMGVGLTPPALGPVFFPPFLMAAALLPPVAAVAWMMDRQPGALTLRRAGVAFVAGATISVGLALVLELLLPGVVLLMVVDVAEPVLYALEELVAALAGSEAANVLTSPGFLLALVGVGVVVPLVEEAVKPLVTLPLLRYLERPRDALLLGAVAGAGFAAMENVVYAMAGLPVWAGILAVRALGAAIHPLGTGVVTLAWHGLLRRQPRARLRWLGGYGLAVGMHALWNGGSALLLALVGARRLGGASPELDVLGVTVTGSLLSLLALEGVAVFVGARTLARRLAVSDEREGGEFDGVLAFGGMSSDQALAVWAVICLLVLLPVGLAVLQATW
jgi:RsiW-degrading membrane proteinase PrsW (M82 family)